MSNHEDKSLDDLTREEIESLDDASRRALLRKIATVGAASVPVTMTLLSADAAAQVASPNQGGTGPGGPNGPGGPGPGGPPGPGLQPGPGGGPPSGGGGTPAPTPGPGPNLP